MAHVLHTHRTGLSWTESNAVVDCQRAIAWSLREQAGQSSPVPYSALSSDALKNAFQSFVHMGVLYKEEKNGNHGDNGVGIFLIFKIS